MSQSPLTAAGFVPTEQDTADLLAWFAEYDALAAAKDVEAMADTGHFPMAVVTNDSAGNGIMQVWDRQAFVHAMTDATEGDLGDLTMENQRRPIFLNRDLAVVVTDSRVTGGDQVQHLRYVDVMVKSAGSWRFTGMIQAGWGDMLKEFA